MGRTAARRGVARFPTAVLTPSRRQTGKPAVREQPRGYTDGPKKHRRNTTHANTKETRHEVLEGGGEASMAAAASE